MDDMTLSLITRLGLSVVLVALGICDLFRARVPNLVVMPFLLAAIPLNVIRLANGELAVGDMGLIITTSAVCWFLWWVHAFGGGDMKLVMVLIGLFPTGQMLTTLVMVLLIGQIGILLGRDGVQGLRQLGGLAFTTSHRSLPTRAEIRTAYRTRRTPITFLISLAGLVYLWLMLAW